MKERKERGREGGRLTLYKAMNVEGKKRKRNKDRGTVKREERCGGRNEEEGRKEGWRGGGNAVTGLP